MANTKHQLTQMVNDHHHSCSRPSSAKKNHNKVSRKIHKAEREKRKRDHMNVLFLELSKAIESASQSNGKASILKDTIRLIKELITQLDYLKKENAALLSESHYVTVEKIELGEENSVLEAQIQTLRGDLEERAHAHESSRSLNISPSQVNGAALQLCENHHGLPSIDDNPSSHATSIIGPVLIVPLQHESQVLSQSDPSNEAMPANVNKPRPRYPSASDSWPSHILDRQQQSAEESIRQST